MLFTPKQVIQCTLVTVFNFQDPVGDLTFPLFYLSSVHKFCFTVGLFCPTIGEKRKDLQFKDTNNTEKHLDHRISFTFPD